MDQVDSWEQALLYVQQNPSDSVVVGFDMLGDTTFVTFEGMQSIDMFASLLYLGHDGLTSVTNTSKG